MPTSKLSSLKFKIGFGFAVILILTLTVGVAGFVALGKVTEKTALYQKMSQVKSIFAEAREQVNQFSLKNYNGGPGLYRISIYRHRRGQCRPRVQTGAGGLCGQ